MNWMKRYNLSLFFSVLYLVLFFAIDSTSGRRKTIVAIILGVMILFALAVRWIDKKWSEE